MDKISYIDYKDIPRLRRHLSERGKIEPRRKTGTCAKHQRALATALKRARHVALLPFTAEHIRLSGMVLRSPDDRRRDDRGPRRDMAPRPPEGVPAAVAAPGARAAPDGTAAPVSANGAATDGATAEGAAAEPTPAPTPVAASTADAPTSDAAPAAAGTGGSDEPTATE